MTFTLGHCNIAQTDSAADEAWTIGTVADRSDAACWNEARDAHLHLINLRGWFSVEAGGLAISWRFAELTKVDHGSKLVMRGGFVGADGVHTPKPGDDDRRVGPGRHVLWTVLDEKATGSRVILATHHSVARADTVAKWRRPLRARGWAGVVTELRAVQKQYPGTPLILTGDFNAIGRVVAFLALGIREVATPATFGRRRYDRVHATPSIVSGARAFATRSDHKALSLKVTLGFVAPPPPAPPKPPEAPVTQFVTRSQWGARPRGATSGTHPIGSTLGITFHWEGPHMGAFPHAACAGKVRGIEAFHRDNRKWADIAYNLLVCPHGTVYEGRGARVRSAANGNTTTNGSWYAVCYLGGQGDPFTDAGKDGFDHAVKWLRDKGDAGARINGHRDHKSTECPGDVIYKWAHSDRWDTKPPTAQPAADKPMNDVEQGKQLIREGVALLRKANKTRTAVHREADEHEAALEKGPKS